MNDRKSSLFLTTAVPYVNAVPHIGHALELLIGDVLARHHRQRGRDVWLTAGTDDHSLKNARAAAALGVETRDLVARNGATFRRLQPALGVGVDGFVHTSQDARHAPAVRELWRRCAAAGDIYSREYTGAYCGGCEAFLQPDELRDGDCPVHRQPPELVTERNWFFRLSRYQRLLDELLSSGRLRVLPAERHREVLAFVRGGLTDFSISRDRARSRAWGIEVPDDPTQVIYVWFDALASYLSVVGFPEPTPEFERSWDGKSRRAHLIGKDILRFHAVYWPAILSSAGLPVPTTVLSHGFVTVEGVKIGKSAGNAVDPFELVEQHGRDAVRFYLLRHLHTTKDSDFRRAELAEAYDAELAHKLGNLLQRASAIALRHPSLALVRGAAAESDDDTSLSLAAARAIDEIDAAVDGFALHRALAAVFELVAAANRYADSQEPWVLSRRAKTAKTAALAADLLHQLAHVLWRLFEALRVIAVLVAPYLPEAAARILHRLGVGVSELEQVSFARFGAERRFCLRSDGHLFPRRLTRATESCASQLAIGE